MQVEQPQRQFGEREDLVAGAVMKAMSSRERRAFTATKPSRFTSRARLRVDERHELAFAERARIVSRRSRSRVSRSSAVICGAPPMLDRAAAAPSAVAQVQGLPNGGAARGERRRSMPRTRVQTRHYPA
ncbi:hypothetical protein BJF79_46560 [Actinomadura sp. CNU-125]|nr:hypothetical protein BJF79_46560 [Actinomadura sp. CNU-125]